MSTYEKTCPACGNPTLMVVGVGGVRFCGCGYGDDHEPTDRLTEPMHGDDLPMPDEYARTVPMHGDRW